MFFGKIINIEILLCEVLTFLLFFAILRLNPLERWVPLLVPKAKNSEKIEMICFSPEMTYMR